LALFVLAGLITTSSDRQLFQKLFDQLYENVTAYRYSLIKLIKHKTQKAVAHAQRAPQLFGFWFLYCQNHEVFLTHRGK